VRSALDADMIGREGEVVIPSPGPLGVRRPGDDEKRTSEIVDDDPRLAFVARGGTPDRASPGRSRARLDRDPPSRADGLGRGRRSHMPRRRMRPSGARPRRHVPEPACSGRGPRRLARRRPRPPSSPPVRPCSSPGGWGDAAAYAQRPPRRRHSRPFAGYRRRPTHRAHDHGGRGRARTIRGERARPARTSRPAPSSLRRARGSVGTAPHRQPRGCALPGWAFAGVGSRPGLASNDILEPDSGPKPGVNDNRRAGGPTGQPRPSARHGRKWRLESGDGPRCRRDVGRELPGLAHPGMRLRSADVSPTGRGGEIRTGPSVAAIRK